MKQRNIGKTLAVAVILLFIGLAIQPSVAITKNKINYPPDEPLIEGPRSVRPGTYNWTFKSIDPNRDDVYYQICWGDDTYEDWIGPYSSGETVKVSHTYDAYGTVCIRARAKDVYGEIGEWGEMDIEILVDPKDYLFQTIIDIANNPDVKEILEQYSYDLFNVDIDRSVYRKLLLRNPRLFFDMFFTKPSITQEYFNKCYNMGIEISNIIGEVKVLEIFKSFKITDTKVSDELNNIIVSNEELSNRKITLNEINKEFKSDFQWRYPIICSLLLITGIPIIIIALILTAPIAVFYYNYMIWNILAALLGPILDILIDTITGIWYLRIDLGCFLATIPPH
jgi:hypothetical protein